MPAGKSSSHTIGFRVDPETEERLRALAAAENKDLSELLRELVQERLEGTETVMARYESLSRELHSFRKDFANSIEAILLALLDVAGPQVGKEKKTRLTASKAKDWVEQRLRKRL